MKCMSHTFFLGTEITLVVWIRSSLNSYVLRYFQTVSLQAYTLHGIIGHQPHFVHSYLTKNLGTYTIITLVCQMSQANISFYSIHAFFLQFICFHFFHQTNAATFLIQIYNYPLTGFLYHLHCLMQLLATITAFGIEYITSGTRRMYTHQNRFIQFPSTLEQSYMLQTVRLLAERNQTEMTVVCRHIHFHSFFYNRLLLQTVGNQVTDGNQFQAKFICHSTQFGQTSHCTILIHYFHKGSRRIKSS